ncbi:serine/threonine-protein kinase [Nocardia nepalensis]|uniref:serine/threonine-protein kinase n=1 Tax=Nocardia nepalensis TaxID=3375448 RepID=UPI003B67303F
MTETPRSPGAGAWFGKYRLDRLIGRGGMGEVYEAYDATKDRTVAIKVLPAQLADDPLYRERFQRESHSAARLQEAHVIPIHDYGEIDGRLYIDMRLVQGSSLRSLLNSTGPLPPARAVALIAQVAAALDAAHAQGLIHRDVKPDNILVTAGDFVYLVDFGIAHVATDARLTSASATIGSFHYIAPERFGAAPVSASVDVYSLACVLYECLTGVRPFTADTDAALIHSHLYEPPPKPSMMRSDIPPGFDAVIARGLAKSPEDRYASAGELARAASEQVGGSYYDSPTIGLVPPDAVATRLPPSPLPAASSGEPLPAASSGEPLPAASSGERGPASVGRKRRWVVVGVIAALVILAAGGLGIWKLVGHRSVSESKGNPAPTAASPPAAPPTDLTAADIGLLKVMPVFGYNRSNCKHQNPAFGADAVLRCGNNPSVGAPGGLFYHFPNADVLTAAYRSFTASLHTSNCPADPPGIDGSLTTEGKEVGRRACYADKSVTPPAPSTIITNNNPAVMEFFNWTDPGGQDALDSFVHDGNAAVQSEPGHDPDFYTPADLELFDKYMDTKRYGKANCRHSDPPSPAKAILVCDSNPAAGAPNGVFFAYPDKESTQTMYDAILKMQQVHGCGGSVGSDDAWFVKGKRVGRYTCMIDPSAKNVPALVASAENAFLNVEFFADSPDSPYQVPKTETELVDWFKKTYPA